MKTSEDMMDNIPPEPVESAGQNSGMKTPEEMMAYFRSMPAKKAEPNPYWMFSEESERITNVNGAALDLAASKPLLTKVRSFFRLYYESFRSEAQVLCVTLHDAVKLDELQLPIPILTKGMLGSFEVAVLVLPQENHMGTSVISEWFWQNKIIGAGIKPVARIHSHHVLDPYQSMTDYSTLNSGTMEMVIGKVCEQNLHLCYWLDVPGTDIKAQTFVCRETADGFTQEPRIFNGPNAVRFIHTSE